MAMRRAVQLQRAVEHYGFQTKGMSKVVFVQRAVERPGKLPVGHWHVRWPDGAVDVLAPTADESLPLLRNLAEERARANSQ